MKPRGYKAYSERLKDHGYEYLPNQPYEGANSWRKFFVKDEGTKVYVAFRVWHQEDFETGEEVYSVSAHGILEDKEKCPHHIDLDFGRNPDLTHIDNIMEEAVKLFEG